MKREKVQKGAILLLFVTFFALSICLFKDYGISTDEPRERETTFLNLNYVLETVKNTSGSEDLEDYRDKYYGIAMQAVPAVIEVLLGLEEPDVFLIRHLWTFLVCFAGYVCFYLLCRKIHLSRGLSLLGTAMLCLYPRFFAEQFYNIKDMMFTAMVMISMFCTVMVIEKRYSLLWMAVFSIAAALTANVRIVGVIFPILLLGAFCGAQRTSMRFRADAVRSITDALKRLLLSVSFWAGSLQCSVSLPVSVSHWLILHH